MWFWVPVLATHIGAIIGACIYLIFVGIHFPDEDSETPEENEPIAVYRPTSIGLKI